MDKPKFNKGDLVRWKHGNDVGVVIGFGIDKNALRTERPSFLESYTLVHWLSGNETKVYEKHSSWNGVIVMARAQEREETKEKD